MDVSNAKRGDLLLVGALALVSLVLHVATIYGYGYFRDELYYLASTNHLAWGYVEHPPFSIALLALVKRLLGDSLPALRMVPALCGAATVFLTGTIARQLGGGRFAQTLAALAALLSPEFLGGAHYYSMNCLDVLLWTIAISVLIRALDSSSPRHWIALGLVVGVGLLNKISMSWFIGALLLALLLTEHRRRLATPWPWIAAAIAGVVFLPHVIWQIHNHWPTLEFMRNATARKMVAVPIQRFVIGQVLDMGPGNALLWMTGLVFGLVTNWAKRGRILALIYIAVFILLAAGGRSRASYLAVAYPMLFALGAIAFERFMQGPRRSWLRPVTYACVVLLGVAIIPFALPIFPVATFIRYQAALGMAPHTDERQQMGSLPQQYADMFGWDEMVALVAKAYARLTPEERAKCRVFGQNYGEAGAVDVLGRKYGLPRAISSHNSYWMWGTGGFDGSVLIIIGGDREDNAKFFGEIEVVGQTNSRYAMPYENGIDISIARKPRLTLREAWPKLKSYI
jgi:4-amino-4-deoxy-L-arabinose transferase-like glycosyltransferase